MSLVSNRLRDTMNDKKAVEVIMPIHEENVVVGVVVLCKYMDSEGNIHYSDGGDGGVSPVEAIGMVTAYLDNLRDKIRRASKR